MRAIVTARSRVCTRGLLALMAALPLTALVPAPSAAATDEAVPKSAAAVASAGLAIIAAQDVVSTGPNRAAYTFGTVSLFDRTRVEHTFTLRNSGARPLTISRVKSTCGCTSAVVAKEGSPGGEAARTGAGLPTTLEPGEELALRVTVDLRPLPPGRIRKSVSVYLENGDEPAAIPEVTGTLLPSVSFEPGIVDLKRTMPEERKSLVLTATFEPRLLAAVPDPVLVSSNPAVRVTALSALANSSAPSAGPPSPIRLYRVELAADAPLGPLSGILSFRTRVPAESTAEPDPTAAALLSVRVPLTGRVVGAVSASPQTLALGVVARGQEATRAVTLTGKTTEDLTGLRVESESRWISGELLDEIAPREADSATGGESGMTRTLRVKLAADTPPGGVTANLIVILQSGRRLLLPMSAFVR